MNDHSNENKTGWVVLLTAATMVVEIIFGLTTGSMALLADGIHMGSHVLAIGLSWGAYIWVRRLKEKHHVHNTRILSLSGYTSGILLLVFAIAIIVQAVERFFNPVDILYSEAMIVACIGLVVNLISAFLLHHDHDHSDTNIKAAYLHVIADALTSVAAISGLAAAWLWDIRFVDTIAAIVSSLVIIRWAAGLLRQSGKELLRTDSHTH